MGMRLREHVHNCDIREAANVIYIDTYHTVPDQGSAGPVAYIIRGAPSPRTCNICHFNGCKRNGGGQN